jgi:parallel beta-helix repeat protein
MLDRAAWAVAGALAVALIASYAGVVRGGSLDPGGPPSSTLPQVEPRMPIRQPGSFPITISVPGSYFLTENITGAAGADGIVITADGVTLDLNGFVLSGASTGADGIDSGGANHVTIKNGVIRNWTGAGIRGGSITNGRYEHVQLSSNSGGGIIAGKDSVVSDCQATDNGGNGVEVTQASGASGSSIVSDCIVDGSVLDGIQVEYNVTVTGNTVTNSGGHGIHVLQSGNRIDNNNIQPGLGKAIKVDGSTNLIVRNSIHGAQSDVDIAAGNTSGEFQTQGFPIANPWANIGY